MGFHNKNYSNIGVHGAVHVAGGPNIILRVHLLARVVGVFDELPDWRCGRVAREVECGWVFWCHILHS